MARRSSGAPGRRSKDVPAAGSTPLGSRLTARGVARDHSLRPRDDEEPLAPDSPELLEPPELPWALLLWPLLPDEPLVEPLIEPLDPDEPLEPLDRPDVLDPLEPLEPIDPLDPPIDIADSWSLEEDCPPRSTRTLFSMSLTPGTCSMRFSS